MGEELKFYLVNRPKVCSPISKRGLGNRKLFTFNQALLETTAVCPWNIYHVERSDWHEVWQCFWLIGALWMRLWGWTTEKHQNRLEVFRTYHIWVEQWFWDNVFAWWCKDQPLKEAYSNQFHAIQAKDASEADYLQSPNMSPQLQRTLSEQHKIGRWISSTHSMLYYIPLSVETGWERRNGLDRI